MPFETTHNHNTITEIGGVTLARVIEIINNYTITFEDGQYAVNLSNANSNIGDVVNLNQVSVRSANSAGLTYSETVNTISYNDKIMLNTNTGNIGTQYPTGTQQRPSNNLDDALLIATQRNIDNFYISGQLVIPNTIDISNKIFLGNSYIDNEIILTGQINNNTVFNNVTLSGILNGKITTKKSRLKNITNLHGVITSCTLNEDINIDQNTSENLLFVNCIGQTTSVRPTINLTNIQCDIHFTKFVGDIILNGLNNNQIVTIHSTSSSIEITNNCINGIIIINGVVSDLIDNSGPSCTVIDLRANSVLLNSDINEYQQIDTIGQNILLARIQAALAAALSA
jgi:hypothetical protein